MKFTFERKLALVFLILLMGLAVVGYIAYKNHRSLQDTNYLVQHTNEVLFKSNEVLSLAKDLGGERSYLATNDTDFLAPFHEAREQIFFQLGLLKELTRDNAIQQQRVDSLWRYAEKRTDFVETCIRLSESGKKDEAIAMMASKQGLYWMDSIRLVVTNMQAEESALLAQRKEASGRTMAEFNTLMLVLILVLLVLLIGSFIAIRLNFYTQLKLQEELKQANNFLNSILENIPNMIFVKDAQNLRFVRFNRAGEKLLSQKRENLIGKNDYDFFPKEQADFFTANDREVFLKGEVMDIPEEPIQTPAGTHWLHTKKIPLYDENGNPKYLLGISEDITNSKDRITQIRQLNANLEKTVQQLTSANKEMEAFTYSVSHDLRAPLRIIDGFGEILLKDCRDKLSGDDVRNLEVIIANAKHMGQLIDDLLTLSRLGRMEVTSKIVSMNDMVQEVIDALQLINNTVQYHFNLQYLPAAECDAGLIRQVWINLLSNAMKYSRKTPKPVVEIGSFLKDDKTVYYVKDNGVGFNMKYAGKLFGVFQRLHKPSEFEGTGVGLALVHRIISKHGGSIWAEAQENGGAVFYFTLN
ncbi:MAG TPA: CHASE3 domain-containing protein [Chitinophagales bacterium]|nr:CHASE3 domain-containing protein [Chitinophagales bacterium]